MTRPLTPESKILTLRLALLNYPILADKIRGQMRKELFAKGIISPTLLEQEVEKKAVETQKSEGLIDPFAQETEEVWQKRLTIIRDYLTDFYFAYNLPYSRVEEIIQSEINKNRSDSPKKVFLSFNPELAPWYLLFEQGIQYAQYPPEMYADVKHHLKQIIVVLLKSLVSDQMEFVRIAREFINIFTLKEIKERKIGLGKIGGKSAGMILAYKILTRPQPEDEMELNTYIDMPDTYFLGSDVYYDFKAANELEYTTGLKYRTHEEIERDYPKIRKRYLESHFPEYVLDSFRELLVKVGNSPIIVRSSSLLEDNFGSAFAGKYDSFFLANQGTPEENLVDLTRAVIKIYASVLNPDALFYRQIQGLEDYDERMAVLIQKVEGNPYGRYFFPLIAGVGFSSNPFIWNKKLRREDGFLRIVLGLGSRAVDRVDKDYPRMIGLSHPQLRPVSNAADIAKYSQRMIDVIDLEENLYKTIPITEVLSTDLSGVQYLASVDEGSYIKPIFSLGSAIDPDRMVLTFDNLLKNTDFAQIMKAILKKLARNYKRPVDIEFAVELIPTYPKPGFKIYLLQCRPLSNREWAGDIVVPENISKKDKLFLSTHLVPQGIVENITYLIYVDPIRYSQIPTNSIRLELARIVGRLNKKLEGEIFILMGPGRWGSSNIDLGIKVSYADIYNTRMLVEIAMPRNGATPEASYGTHFFQDLVESNIYPLAIYPDETDTIFNQQFITGAPNCLASLLPQDSPYAEYIKVIDIPQSSHGKVLRVVMNAEESKAVGYLTRP